MSCPRNRSWYALTAIACLTLSAAMHAADADDGLGKLEHLVRAAWHLEQAGEFERAADIYARIAIEAEALRQRAIRKPQEPGAQADGEAVGSQALPAAEYQILVQLKLVEFSWTKVRQTGLSLISLRNLFEADATPVIVDQGGQISEFIALLCKEGLARVLAEPELVTTSGRPATLEIGRKQAGVPLGLVDGLRFSCVARVKEEGRLWLDIDFRGRTAPDSDTPGAGASRGDRSLQARTQIELPSGSTAIFAGLCQAAGSEDKSMLMLLTARLVGIDDKQHLP